MRISIIGSGNVATHLAAAFKNAGHRIVQVYSRNLHNAALLAYHVNAGAIDSLGQLSGEADLFVIAVKDDAIAAVAEELKMHSKLTVHTSGSTDLKALAILPFAGVIYPIQTLSKHKEVDFLSVPLCIEGVDEQTTNKLVQLAQTISNKVYKVSSAQRRTIHLAAVFACNFPNYLYAVAQQLLGQQGLEFDLLRPLIMETAQKVQEHLPGSVQTGPAVRNDGTTMTSHLQVLDNEPKLQEIYRLLSQEIIKNHNAGHGRR